MIVLQGTGVSGGIAHAPLRFFSHEKPTYTQMTSADPAAESARLAHAIEAAKGELNALFTSTCAALGAEHAQLFETHALMLEDEDFLDACAESIAANASAEYAIDTATTQFAAMFAAMDNAYMKERAADIRDVGERVLRHLCGVAQGEFRFDSPCILAARDLSPSDTVRLDCTHICAILTAQGAAQSHTAIFARTLGLPAVVNLGDDYATLIDGAETYLDGATGCVYQQPDDATRAQFDAAICAADAHAAQLRTLTGKQATTAKGKPLTVCANIATPQDVAAALTNDAQGIGLLRSEFLYIGRDTLPDEETQYEAYRTVLRAMEGKPVVVRTLDIGADKQAPYLHLPAEENPALGLRGIRLCLTNEALFTTQLRALYRASAHGNLHIMCPMITSVWEVEAIRKQCTAVRAQLCAEGYSIAPNVPLGIMIETPAAALISDSLAKEVDFFSIGTNDLTQYLLATDRQNAALAPFYNPTHDAVLRLLRTVADNAHAAGIWVGICGELAADTALAPFFRTIGIDELSVAPPQILPVRDALLRAERS